ncbi:MAG: hypothetical protein ACR2HR_05305 [Euzebya sp.]
MACYLTLIVLLAGCEVGSAPVATSATPTSIDPALLQPLTALGECTDAPASTAQDDDVPGLVLPVGAVLTNVTRTDPVISVEGWVPLTPIQLRVFYAEDTDLEIVQTEDEIWEAEILAINGDRRVFVKAQAICQDASLFVAVVAPEDAASAVPVPAGTPGS